ncbi:hypothetical protein MACH10_08340 [Thalassospira tepidiphila]|uniref:hypothetical protein n=1 Tax=Thalassospira tepidiphila TaxID=393657 RepID=UPI00291F0917|nr:hypothetical protein MACH10_08340 [Thalassospira tepidiphila]
MLELAQQSAAVKAAASPKREIMGRVSERVWLFNRDAGCVGGAYWGNPAYHKP